MTKQTTTEEKFYAAQKTAEQMAKIIARTAKSVATFSGQSYSQAVQELVSHIVYTVATGYDPEKEASPTTYAFYQIQAWVTRERREQRKRARQVDYPDEGKEIADLDTPDEIIEEEDFAQMIPDSLVAEINTAYEDKNSKGMVIAAKKLAYHLVRLGQTDDREGRFGSLLMGEL